MDDNFTDDDFDLDSLLAESVQEHNKSKLKSTSTKGKLKLPKTSRTWMTTAEKEEFDRAMKNAEARGLWRPQAAVAMLSRQICLKCGATHTHFQGYFVRQEHNSYRATERWVPAADLNELKGLPKEVKLTLHDADACVECLPSLDYTLPSKALTEPAYATWTPHKNHSKSATEYQTARGFAT